MKQLPTLRNRTTEEKLLFTVTRQQLLPRHLAFLDQELSRQRLRWDLIYQTAATQAVAPLVWSNLRHCPALAENIPGHICTQFTRSTRNTILLKALLGERARAFLHFFARRSIPVMLIKGAALDLTVYRHPWWTRSADVDLMVQCRREDLSAADWKSFAEMITDASSLKRVGVECEWLGHHDVSMMGLLPVDFAQIWKHARRVQVLDQVALVMSAEHMLLAACINACRKRFYWLKALCDISEIVQAADIAWDDFAGTAKEWRCENIAYAALLVTGMTLGCPVPLGVLDRLCVPAGRSHLIRYLSRHMSFCRLSARAVHMKLMDGQLGPSLLLPWAVYSWDQLLRHLGILWRDRRSCAPRR